MRLGILGAGGWGKNLVRVFSGLLGEEAVTVVDPDPSMLDAVRSRHSAIHTATTPSFINWDAAVVAAPAPLHFELALAALKSGVHVLVEKPLALSSEHVKKLIESADANACTLMVDHLLEYHPAVVRLRQLQLDGALGTIRHMTSQRLNLGVIRSEENAWWSLAPHDVSIILHLMGQLPVSVQAVGGTYLQKGIPDVVHASLRFSDGAIAHIHVSWLEPVKTRRLTVVGEHAMATFDDMRDDKLVLRTDAIRKLEGKMTIDKVPESVEQLPVAEPLGSMAEHFLNSLKTGTTPRSDGWDGLRVVRVLEAVQQSMDREGEIVRMEMEDA